MDEYFWVYFDRILPSTLSALVKLSDMTEGVKVDGLDKLARAKEYLHIVEHIRRRLDENESMEYVSLWAK